MKLKELPSLDVVTVQQYNDLSLWIEAAHLKSVISFTANGRYIYKFICRVLR